MLGYQTHNHGSTASLSLYGPRFHSLPGYIEGRHDGDKQQSMLYQDKPLPVWNSLLQNLVANGLQQYGHKTKLASMSTSQAEIFDLPRLVDIEFAAFRFEKVNHALSYRDGTDAAHIRRTLYTYRKYMNNLRSTALIGNGQQLDFDQSLGFKFRKVTLPGSGEIIAFCKSEIVTLSAEVLASPLDTGYESEPQMNRDWFALNESLHRGYCGIRKHCYFGMLATHPDFQHRGAASRLMNELTAEADHYGLEIYCEATKTGRPLYEKYGFVAIKEIIFPTADYGLDLGIEYQTVMVRGALKDGKRIQPRTWDQAVADTKVEAPECLLLEALS